MDLLDNINRVGSCSFIENGTVNPAFPRAWHTTEHPPNIGQNGTQEPAPTTTPSLSSSTSFRENGNEDSLQILAEGPWYWFHDFVATFGVHNRSFYMPYCRFLVWGELLDTGSRPSVVDNWFLTNNRFFTSIPKSSKNVSCNFDLWQPGGWKNNCKLIMKLFRFNWKQLCNRNHSNYTLNHNQFL